MASLFGHGILAFTISKVIDKQDLKILMLLAILSSILPDADVLAFSFGIPYEHMLGHRGFTHSIAFALLWSLVLTVLFSKTKRIIFFIVLFLSTLSHGILDAMTSGGKGVGFLIPFNSERYFFSFRGIKVSPIGIEKFLSEWGLQVLLSELKYIVTPCILVLCVIFLRNKYRK
ncbi:metal-dependent hydrolase [Psychroserpens ponticola]|uniref:Metal-dependent hydrolase n=1 Tax=Psychroserpens ponticola TaxID=2932268 RepID=A0ABY7RYD3_9FLAO|nr:metal-dependent hydrolase [Psychroserpens ponticola]WCO02159.1 metal-dependent hydrolase [Psychroserpens ponticola]